MNWSNLNRSITACRQCPRLIEHCKSIAREKKRAYREETYWGRPVPNFGDPKARLLILGLAPGAHGANRTGRMFTGDRSGDWLYQALFEVGFANQAESSNRGDGLKLKDCAITAICHCAPPANKPSRDEIDNCRDWLNATIGQGKVKVLLALGQIAWKGALDQAFCRGWLSGRRPQFAHGQQVSLSGGKWLLACYHPSQQNTFTGRLTRKMLRDVFQTARQLIK